MKIRMNEENNIYSRKRENNKEKENISEKSTTDKII